MAKVITNTYTYTKTRLSVIDDQFEFFFRCAGMSDAEVEKMLHAIELHQLKAVGVYIEENGYKTAEVELSVDWDMHNKIILKTGNTLNTDIAGWNDDGIAPEAYIPVQKVAKIAKEKGTTLRSWILVSNEVFSDKTKHKAVCDELGYSFGSSVPSFKEEINEKIRPVNEVEELTVATRVIKRY